VKILTRHLQKSSLLLLLVLLAGCSATQLSIAKDTLVSNDAKWRAEGYASSASKVSEHPAYRPLSHVLVGSANAELIAKMQTTFPDIKFVSANSAAVATNDYDAVLLRCGTGVMKHAPNAIWVHTYSAGVDSCMDLPTLEKMTARDDGVIFTNSSGTAAAVIGEHTIAMLLTLSRGLHIFRDEQARSRWSRQLSGEGVLTVINGKTMLVLGLGSIGTEVARRADALGMRVLGTRHSSREGPDFVEYVGLTDETLALVKQADVVVNALPLTNSTRGFVDQEFFATMRDDAFYLSVGRGGTTDTDALLNALKNKVIAGAGLDVTDPEPLPADHPLWKQTNVVITPHLSGRGGDSLDRTFSLVLENIRRFQAGEPMLNIVDIQKGY